ncbi:MAG: PQQ-dependent dehydrogenase, methanol/ethanol family [Steroidobacteraceae bacterium]
MCLAALICLWGANVWAARVIDNAALENEQDGTDWPAYGRTFNEGHYSPLKQITAETVKRLGLAWSVDLDVTNSITAPLAVGGVVYLGAGHGVVYAVDARSGRKLWRYDAKAPQVAHQKLRLGWGIRGIAFWMNRVYAGTTDGRLIALNAADGSLAWSVQTVDPRNGATITGPPRAFNGKIIIGFSGEDFAPLRGYVTAYDAQTGKQAWRFFLVPGKPGTRDGAASDDVMQMAASTWTGDWWKRGGGGGAWNAMTYDPQFNRVYIGTGNGAPMNARVRSPGGGDNLFVASVVALDADTGHYLWHYQTTPGDSWDYDAATDMTLVTVQIDGRARQVMLIAAKNGFIYVIDRKNGQLISAEKLGTVTWADHVDLKTGRPVLAPGATYEKPIVLWPSLQSVHHWPPQSYSPRTGYLYEPTLEMPAEFSDAGFRLGDPGKTEAAQDVGHSVLKAWDPLARRVVWHVETAGISNGGTLATAGDLVFEGLADGYLHAYEARDGKDLWSFFAGVAVTGVPITYSVDGRQYLTITSGPLGGATAAFGAVSARWGWDPRVHPRRLLTFALDANTRLPPTPPRRPAVPLDAPQFQVDAAKARAGEREYGGCMICHGMGAIAGGIAPDLRASPVPLSAEAFAHIVRDGALEVRGMPRFAQLSDAQLEALRHFLRQKARSDLRPPSVHPQSTGTSASAH